MHSVILQDSDLKNWWLYTLPNVMTKAVLLSGDAAVIAEMKWMYPITPLCIVIKKAVDALIRRGHSYGIIRQVLNDLSFDAEDYCEDF